MKSEQTSSVVSSAKTALTAAEQRRARQANALRDNLKRRKQAAQATLAEPPPGEQEQGA